MKDGVSSYADILDIESRHPIAAMPASTYELICRSAAEHSSAPALTFFLRADYFRDTTSWTYAELAQDITRAANMFHKMGAKQQSVIAYVLPNLPETHLTIWGGEAAGIVFAINPMLEGAAIAELLNAAGAEILVTLAPFPDSELWQKLQRELAKVESLRHLVLVNLLDRMSEAEKRVALDMQQKEQLRLHGQEGLRGAVPVHIEIHDFGTTLARESGTQLNSTRDFGADDLSSYFCTGGTTGLPKIAQRSHRNEVANAWSAGQVLGNCIGPGKTVFCGLPLFHVNGAMVTGLLAFSKGAHVLLGTPEGYRGKGVISRFWEIVEHHRVNFFSGVPTVFASLLEIPMADRDVSSLEYGLCGAAPMPVETLRSFQAGTGIKILEGYGLTEATCISTVNPPFGPRLPGSIGLRLPFQDMRAVVLDEAGRYVRDCVADEVGVLAIAGPNVFSGYISSRQNRDIWIDLDDGTRLLNTGDLGRCDSDGYFWLTGRRKDLIIRGGHNIDPVVIEEPLHRHPAVQVAAAIGRPDMHVGELPVAYVQLKPGVVADPNQLLEFLQREIPERAAVPKQIHIVEKMPLTAVGKIFKYELKRREIVDELHASLTAIGIAANVTVTDDKTRGLVVHVDLNDPARETEAKVLLGHFPFPYSITLEEAVVR